MKIQNRRLTLENETVIEFNLPIEHAVKCGEVILVITQDPEKNTENQNLYAYSDSGRFLWRGPDRSFEGFEVCPYVTVKCIDDVHVRVWDYYGVIYTLEALTGNLIEKHWGK